MSEQEAGMSLRDELIMEEAIASVELDGGYYEGADAVQCPRCGKRFHPDDPGVHTCSPRVRDAE